MSSRRAQYPLTFKPRGLSDAVDATNAFPGAMLLLQNLVPATSTAGVFVPRPAAVQLTNFSGFTTPATVSALTVIGTRAYGMIGSADFSGKDVPFIWDLVNNVFVTITGEASGNLPNTQPTTGDWQPPHMEMIAGRVIVTHPGFGGSNKFGWIDVSGFSLTENGTTHSNTTLDGFSTSPIASGINPGMAVTGAGIPANTTVVSVTATTVTISNAATASATVALTFAGGTFAAPTWNAGNTNTNGLPAVANWVSQFNGRAWFSVGNALIFSDALNPLQVTNATQVLTLGDTVAFTCSAGAPLNNITTGGVIQALFAFKGAEVIYQVTGDAATSNLVVNQLPVNTGTLAPNTLAETPQGLAFMAPDGLRFISPSGLPTDVVGSKGQGVSVPFINALNPSRMAAAFNQNVLRITCQNGQAQGQPTAEYWLHFDLKAWSGPHTCACAVISPYNAGVGHIFVQALSGVSGKLFASGINPLTTDTYSENGAALSWAWQPCLLPDNQQMEQNRMGQTAIAMAIPANIPFSFTFLNEVGLALNQVSLQQVGAAPVVWGGFNWGSAPWGQMTGYFQQYNIPWTGPLIFKQGSILVVGSSVAGTAIGNLYMRYQILGYLLNVQTAIIIPPPAAQPITTEGGIQIVTEGAAQQILTEGVLG